MPSAPSSAHVVSEKDIIRQLCGCFEVTFEYAETFPHIDHYQIAQPYREKAFEYIALDEETPDKMVLQHLLMVNKEMIIKHWREDWEYEPETSFTFLGNGTWINTTANAAAVKGLWSQKVYEVDETPRYCGVASWRQDHGEIFWESVADAPLPRREYSHRDDYQILRRRNRLWIKAWGWVHEQDNEKIIVDDGKQTVLVEEKGRNVYRRVAPQRCSAAASYWEEQRNFWRQVRAVWETWLSQRETYTFVNKIGENNLRDDLHQLSGQPFTRTSDMRDAIEGVLCKYKTVITQPS